MYIQVCAVEERAWLCRRENVGKDVNISNMYSKEESLSSVDLSLFYRGKWIEVE